MCDVMHHMIWPYSMHVCVQCSILCQIAYYRWQCLHILVHTKQVGILCDTLLSSHKLKLKKLTKGALTIGVLPELNDFHKENDIADLPPSEDEIWKSLTVSSEYDVIAQELLQMLFSSFSVLLSRLLHDHLTGGELDNPSHQLQEETKSVPKTNTVSEHDFAKLDRLLREKSNATTLYLEAMILLK